MSEPRRKKQLSWFGPYKSYGGVKLSWALQAIYMRALLNEMTLDFPLVEGGGGTVVEGMCCPCIPAQMKALLQYMTLDFLSPGGEVLVLGGRVLFAGGTILFESLIEPLLEFAC